MSFHAHIFGRIVEILEIVSKLPLRHLPLRLTSNMLMFRLLEFSLLQEFDHQFLRPTMVPMHRLHLIWCWIMMCLLTTFVIGETSLFEVSWSIATRLRRSLPCTTLFFSFWRIFNFMRRLTRLNVCRCLKMIYFQCCDGVNFTPSASKESFELSELAASSMALGERICGLMTAISLAN